MTQSSGQPVESEMKREGLRRWTTVLLLASLLGFALRLAVSYRGHNYDMDSRSTAAAMVLNWQNPYAVMQRYNYGPVWFVVLYVLGWIHDTLGLARFGIESFHFVVASFLSLVDVAVAVCLMRRSGLASALFFVLNPVLILLTGYHSQIDTLAILLGLIGWMLIEPAPADAGGERAISWPRAIGSGICMAVSLSTKHLLILLPACVALCPGVVPGWKKRVASSALAYGLFAALFLPFARTPEARAGIWENVITYEGVPFAGVLLPALLKVIVPARALYWNLPLLHISLLKAVFAACVLAIGLLIGRRSLASCSNAIFWPWFSSRRSWQTSTWRSRSSRAP
jgi:hypothetical protein